MNEKSKNKWSRNACGESCLLALSSSVIYTRIYFCGPPCGQQCARGTHRPTQWWVPLV